MRNPILAIRRASVAINMTPMIDVTFLLIIFFLVSSHLSNQENNVKLDLPLAANAIDASLVTSEHSLTINLTPEGMIQLGGGEVSIEQLANLLGKRMAQVEGQLQVRIRCDSGSAYSLISPILKSCARAGVSDVVFAVYDRDKR